MTVNNHFTAYELIASDIREKIEDNIYKSEQRLPSVLELCSEYNASDSTIRKSLDILKKEGYIYSKKRVGVFVSSIEEKRFILKFNEFSNLKEPVTASEILKFGQGQENRDAKDLRFSDKKHIVCHRIYYAGAFPVLYKIDYILYNARMRLESINAEKWIEEMDLVMESPAIYKRLALKIEMGVPDIREAMILAEESILYKIRREYYTEKKSFVGVSEIFVANHDLKLQIYEK
ncbi:GntR family transcriptional regulator [Eubacterium sp. 1001713B170207_170306_E7]|uniref:GntR family transcriptional regulator n=1 Tax=Eubacterium sp. 1001713B170207_170306_E7 TaxID=2787097 RepID=UPI00189BA0D8|nr:GntR family transcriptional regulator [Eubacterium sp. 1001713B170207_170306_E7]